MRTKSIYRYIYFGTALRYLQDAELGMFVNGKGRIIQNIDSFISSLEEFNLAVTKRAANDLVNFRKKFKKSNPDRALTIVEAEELRNIMTDLRKTLMAESLGNYAFIVTDKRLDVKKLLSNVPGLLSPGIFDLLPNIAQYDFSEAGKCIAFERSTAAAFHLLRGAESVLRHFYCNIVKRNRVELLWGPMIESLRARRSPPSTILLNNLDNIKNSFRNPTQHPEYIYNIDEVQDLFGLCVDVVNRMINIIKNNSQKLKTSTKPEKERSAKQSKKPSDHKPKRSRPRSSARLR